MTNKSNAQRAVYVVLCFWIHFVALFFQLICWLIFWVVLHCPFESQPPHLEKSAELPSLCINTRMSTPQEKLKINKYFKTSHRMKYQILAETPSSRAKTILSTSTKQTKNQTNEKTSHCVNPTKKAGSTSLNALIHSMGLTTSLCVCVCMCVCPTWKVFFPTKMGGDDSSVIHTEVKSKYVYTFSYTYI